MGGGWKNKKKNKAISSLKLKMSLAKSPKGGGGSVLKMKKSTIQNEDSFEMSGFLIFRFFQNSNN